MLYFDGGYRKTVANNGRNNHTKKQRKFNKKARVLKLNDK
ncbi:hypothetical protein SPWS13_4618 [Shewanella putrefaciens]|nr:hypothetical protein SPWS13_4618 [Shewanella putrefaciens]